MKAENEKHIAKLFYKHRKWTIQDFVEHLFPLNIFKPKNIYYQEKQVRNKKHENDQVQ